MNDEQQPNASGERGNEAERQVLLEFLNRPVAAAAQVSAASEEDRLTELEREVARLKDVCAPFTGDGSLTGRAWRMNWGTILWGNDGFQLIQDEGVQDCPEIGFATWRGNSIGKFSFRVIERASGGISANELVLVQGKRETGSSQHEGSDAEDGRAGCFRVDCNDGGGSNDGNMHLVFEALAHLFNVRVASNIGGGGGPVGAYAQGLKAPGAETRVDCQGDRPVLVCYDNRTNEVVWWLDWNGAGRNPNYKGPK